jgi:predicted HD superfamily hydrolase involved in NAD metabolism
MDIEVIKSKLQERLSEKRYSHCLRVAQAAKEIADHHNLDSEKAYLAGLLHDLAREMDLDQQKEIIENNNIELREDELNCIGIWHGFVGAILAREEFGIEDPEILEAIQFHSVGDKNMGVIAKIIYITDIIEPERKEPEEEKKLLESIRNIVKEDINKALLEAVLVRINTSAYHGTIVLSRGVELRDELVKLVSEDKKL